MSVDDDAGRDEPMRFTKNEAAFRIAEAQFDIKNELQNHEGRIVGLQTALSALQSAFQFGFGAWLTVVSIAFALLVGLGGWQLIQMRADAENVRADLRDVRSDVRNVSSQLNDLDEKVDMLPDQIADAQRHSRR